MKRKFTWSELFNQIEALGPLLARGVSERAAAAQMGLSKSHVHRIKELSTRLTSGELKAAYTFQVEAWAIYEAFNLSDKDFERYRSMLLRGEIRTLHAFKCNFYK